MVMWGRNKPNPEYAADPNSSFDTNRGEPNPNFAVDENAPSGYTTLPYLGYADRFEPGLDATPDEMRLRIVTPRQTPEVDQETWYDKFDRNTAERESVVQQSNDFIDTNQRAYRRVDSPYQNVYQNSERPLTAGKNPNNWSFLRPFMQPTQKGIGSHNLNGNHFSMAGHRRDYEIYGMAPVRTSRNTFRLDPTPWDQNIVDAPDNTPGYVTKDNRNSEPGYAGTRSFRL